MRGWSLRRYSMSEKNKFIPKILIDKPVNLNISEITKGNKLIFHENSPLHDDHNSASLLSEYDLIILNYSEPAMMTMNREEQLNNFVKSGKTLIFILNKFIGDRNGVSNYFPIRSIFENYFIFRELEKGDNFALTKFGVNSECKNYLEHGIKKFNISVNNAFGSDIISLADNVENNSVAFICKKYPNCYFLPWMTGNEEEFAKLILKLVFEGSNVQPVEDWVRDYSFSDLINVENKINEIQNKIDDLEKVKMGNISEKKKYEEIRDTLLYRDGKILEDVVKKVFIDLGIEIQLGKEAREDLIFIFKTNHYLIEVKGCEKSTNKGHVKQVISHVVEYTEEEDTVPKGILIINAWRKLPIEERNTNDKPLFPNELMKLVSISHITLMTTQQLFVAYCDNLEGKFDLEEFIQKIDTTNGVLVGYDDIRRFKSENSKSMK